MRNAITAQEYLNREDMSPVLQSIKTEVTTSFTATNINQGTGNTNVAKLPNFIIRSLS